MSLRPSLSYPIAPTVTASTAVGRLPFAALILGNIALAFGPWFVRLAQIGPVASGFWRVAIALPLLFAFAAWAKRTPVRASGAVIGLVAFAGLCFALDLAAWHSGILRTKLANAVLFGNVASFFFTAYGFILARSLPSTRQGGAILLAICGVGLLLGRSYQLSPDHLGGDLLCLVAGLTYTGYMIAVDRVRPLLGTWRTLAFATLAAAIALLPLAYLADGSLRPTHWEPLVALALGSQVIGQGLIVYAIGTLPAMVVGLGLLTQPVAAAAIGWVIYGERLGPLDCVGAVMIGVALVLIRRR